MFFLPDPVLPSPHLQCCVIYFNMSCFCVISLKDCYPDVLSHFSVFSGFFFSLFGALHLAEYRLIIITFRRKAPGSITISLKYVGDADKSGQQVLVRFSFISELLCLSFPSLCTPSVIRKEPRSRLTRHTHIRTHQITQYDWFQAVLGVCCLCFQL